MDHTILYKVRLTSQQHNNNYILPENAILYYNDVDDSYKFYDYRDNRTRELTVSTVNSILDGKYSYYRLEVAPGTYIQY